MNENHIKVYPYDLAPEELRVIANQGGDEDWIVIVPKCLLEHANEWLPYWITVTDSMREPVRIALENGDVMFVGCHA